MGFMNNNKCKCNCSCKKEDHHDHDHEHDHEETLELIFTDKELKKNSKIEIHFVGDKEIKDLNKETREKDYPTDVLSIEINEELPNKGFYIGDIIINIDQAKRQMKEYGNDDVRLELAELAGHGVLHLLGIHHKGDH